MSKTPSAGLRENVRAILYQPMSMVILSHPLRPVSDWDTIIVVMTFLFVRIPCALDAFGGWEAVVETL